MPRLVKSLIKLTINHSYRVVYLHVCNQRRKINALKKKSFFLFLIGRFLVVRACVCVCARACVRVLDGNVKNKTNKLFSHRRQGDTDAAIAGRTRKKRHKKSFCGVAPCARSSHVAWLRVRKSSPVARGVAAANHSAAHDNVPRAHVRVCAFC